ncbi:forkhead box protein H1 [Osmerus mordax]|uniref:forkhead box protein H1 n=1 Tax=Osmerus mordax TaxID=8014 RepID=UPI00350FE269
MTKHWGGQRLLALNALSYLRFPSLANHHDHQLDSTDNVYQWSSQSNITRRSPTQHWEYSQGQEPVQQSLRHEKPLQQEKPVKVRFTKVRAPMDKVMSPDDHRRPARPYLPTQLQLKDAQFKESEASARESWDRVKNGTGGRKKNYQRYPKPPYSYLAMIAMVIQNSPEKKLTLSEILKEIGTLFPFFKGNYKGWRDSVRHNLSSYDCFVKVLKDPGKPQGKGNFWAVEVSRVPVELLKRQNTAVSRQDETVFAQDLAPYILQGHPYRPDEEPHPAVVTALPPLPTRHPSLPLEDAYRPKLDSSFAIDSLLHSLRPASASGEPSRPRDPWGMEHPRPSPPLHPSYFSSTRSASASSASPASSSSDEDWRGASQGGKRPPEGETGSDGYEDCRAPPHKANRRGSAAPWELPTSYAKYAPPNAVAPPSMRFHAGPLMPLGSLPLYGYGGAPVAQGHFVGHAYWPILPSGHVSLQAPPLIMDLDSMLQSVPPNKSVFDLMGPQGPHQPPDQYGLQGGGPLSRYPQY